MNYNPHLLDAEPVDLFRDLDTDILEIFQRGQAQMFYNLPADEQRWRLDQLNRILTSAPPAPYCKLVWVFNVLPLPVVRYRRLWRDFRPRAADLVLRMLTSAAVVVAKALRVTMFVLCLLFYLSRIVERFFMFGNQLTFSDNFFRDIYSYVMQDHPAVLSTCALVAARGYRYLVGYTDELEALGHWAFCCGVVRVLAASAMVTRCERTDAGVVCHVDRSTLIFKFDRALRRTFPGASHVPALTVAVYMAYALVGNFLCMNILYYYAMSCFGRITKNSPFVASLSTLLWNGLASVV